MKIGLEAAMRRSDKEITEFDSPVRKVETFGSLPLAGSVD